MEDAPDPIKILNHEIARIDCELSILLGKKSALEWVKKLIQDDEATALARDGEGK